MMHFIWNFLIFNFQGVFQKIENLVVAIFSETTQKQLVDFALKFLGAVDHNKIHT